MILFCSLLMNSSLLYALLVAFLGGNDARQEYSNASIEQTNTMLSACSAEDHDNFHGDFEIDGERGNLVIKRTIKLLSEVSF